MKSDSVEIRSRIGYLPHNPPYYPELTGVENLQLWLDLNSINNSEEVARNLLGQVGLISVCDELAGNYSRGMIQRLGFSMAISHSPTTLLLDEPFTGLDLHASNILKEHLQRLHDRRRTILMITHDIACGLEMCDKVALQVKGKFVYFENIANVDREQFESMYFDAVRDSQFGMNQS